MQDFYEEKRNLNIKKVVILSIIIGIIILSIIFIIVRKFSNSEGKIDSTLTTTSTLFKSSDNSISVELPNTFGLKQYNSNLDYLIELRSKNNLNIFISKENVLPNKNFIDIIEADKIAFLEGFEACSNLSETKELSINNNLAYTYSFHYLDKTLNKAFYLQVTWLQIGNIFYIFDIEFPLDDLSFNTNVSSNVLSSFKINT